MRGSLTGLASPHPLGPALPAIYQDDEFALRLEIKAILLKHDKLDNERSEELVTASFAHIFGGET